VSIADGLWADLSLLWPVLVVGILVFAIWGATKAAARATGYHFGALGVGVVFLLGAVASFYLYGLGLAVLLGVVALILLAVGFTGRAR
jgi:hypothetical protein